MQPAIAKLPDTVSRWIDPVTGEIYWDYWYNYIYGNNPEPPVDLYEFASGQVEHQQRLVELERSGEADRLCALMDARKIDFGPPSSPGPAPVKPGMETDAMKTAVAREVASAWPAPVRASDLCARPPATPPELFCGLMYRGGTMILSGASKSRKTYTMLGAGLAVAGGHPWLGIQTIACPVLYLNLELQDFAVAHRLNAIARAMGVPLSRELHLVNLRNRLVTLDSLELRIGKLIESTQAGLVVVDPHYKLSSASGVEENSNDAQALFLYRIESAICSTGAGVMIAHHFSKGNAESKRAMDRASGAGALARWPDVVMSMTEHEEADCVTAEFSLRNFAPVDPFVLRWRHPVWTVDSSVNPALLKRAGTKPETFKALDLFAVFRDGMTNKEWFAAAAGWTDGTYRRKRDELIRMGKVKPDGSVYRGVSA